MAMDLSLEKEYLEGLKKALGREADKLVDKMNDISKGYLESARYIWENQSQFDQYEMIFDEIVLNQIVDAGEQTRERFRRIVKMLDSPYFARIDFLAKEDFEAMKVYIGKFPFWDGNGEYEVFDWRAPISGMYYEFENGAAYYDAPVGRIEGELICKRQYRISRGILEYALESSLAIDDEVLQRELAKTSDHRMKDIVSTIQREQNRLIRNETAEVLIIQGVAGSGKTSIALHRVAYFLYRYRNEISAKNFLIISPNGIFVDFISGVLPELGEEVIRSIGMEDIAASFLPKEIRAQRSDLQTERFLTSPDEEWFIRNTFKGTRDFLELLDEYLKYCDEHNFRVEDYLFEGGCIEAEFIRKSYERKKRFPVRQRLLEIADDIREEICAQNKARALGAYKHEILEWLVTKLKCNDALALYANFYNYIGKRELFVYEQNGMLESADIFPFIYVKLYLEGDVKDENIKYLLVDEMQDYTPVQYAVLNRLYPCKKTILGDFYQNVAPFAKGSLSYLKEIYPNAQVMEIQKSYRSTYEIMKFAGKIRRDIVMEPVKRHGEEPMVLECNAESAQKEKIYELAEEAFSSDNSFKLGILAKCQARAEEMYHWMMWRAKKEQIQKDRLHLLDSDSREFYDGVMVTSVTMSKGLEFDCVIVIDVDDETYHTEYDRSLLYVACTRAMHKLVLLHVKEVSRFLEDSLS